jgi:hypothetical protein
VPHFTFRCNITLNFAVLHRASEARKHVPEGLKLVSLFGYTLGGVYLARYSDSPVGAFDELVVLAGLVWNAPTSCAWAQRVYVNKRAARDHGLKHVGLPSRLATFSQADKPCAIHRPHAIAPASRNWWNVPFALHRDYPNDHAVLVGNCEQGPRGCSHPVARLILPATQAGWAPRIRMHLPNFSGGTTQHPGLLHYTCELVTRVRPMPLQYMRAVGEYDAGNAEDVSAVLQGKPVLCLSFEDMTMHVPDPKPLQIRRVKRTHVATDVPVPA